MHLSMVNELISKPCTSWVSVSWPIFAKSHVSMHDWAVKAAKPDNWPSQLTKDWLSAITLHWGTLGKFDWGVRYVIIFLYVPFWIRLGTINYRGKKVWTVDSPAVRSVNKSRDTRNSVQNELKYAICFVVATRLYYKDLGIILCASI